MRPASGWRAPPYSILTLTIKVCLALGTAVGLIFVQVSGYYDALGAGTFTTKTKDIIFFAYTALPGVLALLSIFPMFKYDIVGEKKAQISAACPSAAPVKNKRLK